MPLYDVGYEFGLHSNQLYLYKDEIPNDNQPGDDNGSHATSAKGDRRGDSEGR